MPEPQPYGQVRAAEVVSGFSTEVYCSGIRAIPRSSPRPDLGFAKRREHVTTHIGAVWQTQVNASWFSFSLDEAERVPYYEILARLW